MSKNCKKKEKKKRIKKKFNVMKKKETVKFLCPKL